MLAWASPAWVPAVLIPLALKGGRKLGKCRLILLALCELTLVFVAVALFGDVSPTQFRLSLYLWPVVVFLFIVSVAAKPGPFPTSIVLLALGGVWTAMLMV